MAAEIEGQVKSILERNERVEADKAWETSKLRRAIIAAVTYIIVLYFLLLANIPNPYVNALVPAMAYVLSTLSIPVLKGLWAKKIYRK